MLLGENGTGKTSILQAMALGIGASAFNRFWLDAVEWVKRNVESRGEISLAICHRKDEHAKPISRTSENIDTNCELKLRVKILHDAVPNGDSKGIKTRNSPLAKAIACGYGPFRRFWGYPPTSSNWYDSYFSTLFDETRGLQEGLHWLPAVYARSEDPKHPERSRAKKLLPCLQRLIDSVLPEPVSLVGVNSEQMLFGVARQEEFHTSNLSDGYRSFLAMFLDFLKRLYDERSDLLDYYNEENGPCLTIEGVVLIDEADAHIHPRWQRELGPTLRRVFPKIQFIVTTHSPFIAQEASDNGLFVLNTSENGTVGVDQPFPTVRAVGPQVRF